MRHLYRSRLFTVLAVALLAGTIGACSMTTFESAWSDPSAGLLDFKKVVAVAITSDGANRRAAEDAIVAHIGADRATASYSVVTGDERNAEKVSAMLREAGFDAAVVVRFVGKEDELNWSPGTSWAGPYSSFGGYYGYGYGFYDPGYMYTQTNIRLETMLYSLRDDKLIWAGLSSTADPKNVQSLIREVAEAAVKDMKQRGLLPKT